MAYRIRKTLRTEHPGSYYVPHFTEGKLHHTAQIRNKKNSIENSADFDNTQETFLNERGGVIRFDPDYFNHARFLLMGYVCDLNPEFLFDMEATLKANAPAYNRSTDKPELLHYHIECQRLYNWSGKTTLALFHAGKVSGILRNINSNIYSVWMINYYYNLACTYYLMGRYKTAFKWLMQIISNYKLNIEESKIIHELILFTSFKLQYKLDTLRFRTIFLKSVPEEEQFLKSKWKYYTGMMDIMLGKYKPAEEIFAGKCGFKKNNMKWYIHSVLIEIVCKLELGKISWFEYRMEALRKCMDRYMMNCFNHDGEYVHLIFSLIRRLRRYKYSFETLLNKEYETYLKLSSMSDKYLKNPCSPSVFDYAQWFRDNAKMRKTLME